MSSPNLPEEKECEEKERKMPLTRSAGGRAVLSLGTGLFPGQEVLEGAGAIQAAGLAQGDFNNAVGHLVDELMVVAGEEQVAGIGCQAIGKSGDAFQIQMVGGLIQQ